jgi:enediyne biosynthesis protein E5
MVTDPKTTVRSKFGQCVVVLVIAFVEMILRLNQVLYAPFYALFIVGPIAMLIDLSIAGNRSQESGFRAGPGKEVSGAQA